jgi:S1-C subfamily serine protease
MSETNKDHEEFEFIKEQILPKRHKKFKKWLIPFVMTILMAVVFGLVAALTFCFAEPRLYKRMHGDKENPFTIPSSPIPDKKDDKNSSNDNKVDNKDHDGNKNSSENDTEDPDGPVADPDDNQSQVIYKSIDADIEDYVTILSEIKELSNEAARSILTVSCIVEDKDWFDNPIEKKVNTSGIVVKNNGTSLLLLVSLDRVKEANSIKVEISESTSVEAVLHDYESELNLAILAVNAADIPARLLGDIKVANLGESYALTVGSPIIALGNPSGYISSMDIGIITSKGSTISITDNELDLFNTNMTFTKDSDGVIVNFKGEVIGLITRTLKQNINKELSTVLGITRVKPYIERMVNQKSRIYCGIVAENLPESVMLEHNVKSGIYVYEVKTDSPAFNAGIRSGDIILGVGDGFISNMNNFYRVINEYEPGTEVVFKVKRSNTDKEIELKVVIAEKKQ